MYQRRNAQGVPALSVYLNFVEWGLVIEQTDTYIRTTDPDDATTLVQLYAWSDVRCALLDQKREPMMPTVDELREILASPEAAKGAFHTLEDGTGQIRGFCCLRGLSQDTSFCEVSILPLSEANLELPCIDAGMKFILKRAFAHHGLQKVMTHVLDKETRVRAFYLEHGFSSAGTQREALYANGKYHDIEALICWNPQGARRVIAEGAESHAN